jgi:hypothetical protein
MFVRERDAHHDKAENDVTLKEENNVVRVNTKYGAVYVTGDGFIELEHSEGTIHVKDLANIFEFIKPKPLDDVYM